MILDTSFLIDFLKNREEAIEKYSELKKHGEELFITSISVFEVMQGTSRFHSHEKIEKTKDFLKSISCFYFNFDAAMHAGEIMSELRRKGKTIDAADTMIAGIAKIQNQIILTRNVKHFERITGIKIESY